jgi:Winged helix-turn-helix DNA-binding
MGENIPVDPSSREACVLFEPLPDGVVVRLRSDPTAALAAVLVVNAAFPNIVAWAARTFAGQSHTEPTEGGGEANGGEGGHGKKGNDAAPRQRKASEHADQRLLALMRDNPGATIAQLTKLSGRSRSSIVLSLKRLEEAGSVSHGGHGSWAVIDYDPHVTDEEAPLPPNTAHWVAPLSGRHVARHTAGGRVRQENAAA